MEPCNTTGQYQLARNLAALGSSDASLVARLALPMRSEHIVVDGNDHVLRNWRGTYIDLDGGSSVQVAPGIPGARGVWFGAGSGRGLVAALERGESFDLWEPDPQLLRVLLERRDVASYLASGALRIVLGADLVVLARNKPKGPLVADSATAHMRPAELRLLASGGRRPIAVLVEGRLLVDAIATALDRRGVDSYQLDVEGLAREELDRALALLQPAFVLAINETSGLAEWTADAGVPLVVYEIDPTTDEPAPLARRAPSAALFTYRRAHVELYRRAGWQRAEYLPLTADPLVRRPRHLAGPERLRYRAPVAFVGASMAAQGDALLERFVAGLRKLRGPSGLDADLAKLERVLLAQLADLDHYRVPELLEAEFGDALAAWRDSGLPERPEALVAEIAASKRRAAVVNALAPQGIEVWGDAGWRELLAGPEQRGARYRGPAGNRAEIDRIYSGADVNVDVGRLYQNDIVTLRVFDVLACGGFCLTEANDEVASLFDVGGELDCYATRAELVRKTAHYLDHPEEARAIGARGRRAILERHALDLRLDHMLAGLVPQRGAVAA